jgi:Holliday junction resolvase RusA-like endonuclease
MADMDPIVFNAYGTPRPQPRPRVIGKRAVSTVDPKARLWREAVMRGAKAAADSRKDAVWIGGPVSLVLGFEFPTPKVERWGQDHTGKPDTDNLAKLVMDCMEGAGLLPAGDQRVAELKVTKRWAAKGSVSVLLKPCAAQPRAVKAVKAKAPSWLTA